MGKSDSVLIIAVVAAGAYLFFKSKDVVKTQYKIAETAAKTIQDEYIKKGGTYTTTDKNTGERFEQERGFSTQHNTSSFADFMAEQSPIVSIPVWLGTLENSIIDYVSGGIVNPLRTAAESGAEFRIALEKSGDVQRFEDMSLYGRALPSIGEGISRTVFGWSPYEAGQDFAKWWNT